MVPPVGVAGVAAAVSFSSVDGMSTEQPVNKMQRIIKQTVQPLFMALHVLYADHFFLSFFFSGGEGTTLNVTVWPSDVATMVPAWPVR